MSDLDSTEMLAEQEELLDFEEEDEEEFDEEVENEDEEISESASEQQEIPKKTTASIIKAEESSHFHKEVIGKPEDRITSSMLTLYEVTSIVGTRAEEIDATGVHFADLTGIQHLVGTLNALDVARIELKQRKCPLLIKRELTRDFAEVINPNECIFPRVAL